MPGRKARFGTAKIQEIEKTGRLKAGSFRSHLWVCAGAFERAEPDLRIAAGRVRLSVSLVHFSFSSLCILRLQIHNRKMHKS